MIYFYMTCFLRFSGVRLVDTTLHTSTNFYMTCFLSFSGIRLVYITLHTSTNLLGCIYVLLTHWIWSTVRVFLFPYLRISLFDIFIWLLGSQSCHYSYKFARLSLFCHYSYKFARLSLSSCSTLDSKHAWIILHLLLTQSLPFDSDRQYSTQGSYSTCPFIWETLHNFTEQN